MIGALLLTKNSTHGLLIPHHLLAKENIEKIYAENTSKDVETVIVISPNHFNYGYNYIQTTDQNQEDHEQNILEIDKNLLEKIADKSSVGDKPAKIENKNFKKEHGIGVHVPFIIKNFPQAKLLAITLKRNTPQAQLDELITRLTQSIGSSNIIIIASIDFSHYVAETTASKTDEKIINWLTKWSTKRHPSNLAEIIQLAKTDTSKNQDTVAMDSPESLYVFLKILENKKLRNFQLFARTSTQTLTGINDPNQNTSHILGTIGKPSS